ncbi:MAG TPA: hypothetical protein VFP84_05475 [Kofleriaceae bacterium]|nr:hypothetical protein [Kofleriaceae bacterium]
MRSILWNIGLAVGLVAVAAVCWPRRELTVERINIDDRDGTRRLVITNRDRFPDLVIDGRTMPRSARTVQPAGIVLYDEHGNEAGGYGTTNTADGTAQSMMILDHGRSEAIGIVQRHAGRDASAQLVINDREGRPRIRLQVDAEDRPSIAILDEAGREVSRVP